MRILLTGASGFLGARIARLLCSSEHPVRAAFHPREDAQLLRGLPLQLFPCDLLDELCTRRAVEGVDTVIHTAALVSFDPRRYADQVRVNVEGTRLLLGAACRAQVGCFIYTSTVNTLGAPPAGQVGDERTPFDWHPWRLGYMDSKKAAEDLVLRASGRLRALSLLPGTLFGPGDIHLNAGQYILQIARGLGLAAPPGGTCVAHVDDVARGHLRALSRGSTGERYVLGGENLSYPELFRLIAEELGQRPPQLTLPAGALRLAGRVADRLGRRLGAPLPFSEGLAVAACSRLYYSSAKAQRELGYRFRPAAEAIADAVRWYRQAGRLPGGPRGTQIVEPPAPG